MKTDTALRTLHELSYQASSVPRSYRLIEPVDGMLARLATELGVSPNKAMQAAIILMASNRESEQRAFVGGIPAV